MSETTLRPFPESARKPGDTRQFLETYRAAFEADPLATFCAGEFDGLVLVIATRDKAEQLRRFVIAEFGGVIQQVPAASQEPA